MTVDSAKPVRPNIYSVFWNLNMHLKRHLEQKNRKGTWSDIFVRSLPASLECRSVLLYGLSWCFIRLGSQWHPPKKQHKQHEIFRVQVGEPILRRLCGECRRANFFYFSWAHLEECMPGNITLCEHIRTNMIIIFQWRLMPFIFTKRFWDELRVFRQRRILFAFSTICHLFCNVLGV